MRVLDLACGHGDLANRLAARGCLVTGLDSSSVFLDRARADAAAAGVTVEYVAGDMRQIPWTGCFDRIANWSTAFGYFDDTANRAVLDGIVRALRPGGRLRRGRAAADRRSQEDGHRRGPAVKAGRPACRL